VQTKGNEDGTKVLSFQPEIVAPDIEPNVTELEMQPGIYYYHQ
jgi:hypothetical protein